MSTSTIAQGVTPRRLMTSEWIKFRTLRSSGITLLAAAVLMIAFGAILGYSTSTSDWATLSADSTAGSAPLNGYRIAQLLVGVLGVLFVSGEYATGMIRSSFAAVPRRLGVLRAKTAVFSAVVTVVMTVASFAAFFAAQAFLGPDGHGSSLSDPGVLRSVAGVGLYLTLIGVLGGALGWILRSTAGGISALIGLLLVLPVVIGLLPGSISDTVSKFLPGEAGGSFVTTHQAANTLDPLIGIGVLALWTAAALAAAAVVLLRRDV